MKPGTMIALALFGIACLASDVYPHFGPPNFRYTGSDPTIPVWNFGWPLALAIYDPRDGLHFGPGLYAVPPFQSFLLLMAMGLLAILRLSRHVARSIVRSLSASDAYRSAMNG